MHYEELAEPARYLKGTEEGVQRMCRVFEEVAKESYQEGVEYGAEQKTIQIIRTMQKTMTDEQIATTLELPIERVLSLLES